MRGRGAMALKWGKVMGRQPNRFVSNGSPIDKSFAEGYDAITGMQECE
jgi:hypothetical protein